MDTSCVRVPDLINTITIIPARKGSKGLPGKNVALLNGHPLIARPILDIKNSGVETDIIVSTDCTTIQDIAISYGAHVPFLRPAEFALDNTTTEDTLRIALAQSEQYFGKEYQYAIFLAATDIYRDPLWIKECYDTINGDHSLESVFIGYPTTKNYWHSVDGKWQRICPWMREYGSRQTRNSIVREDTGVCSVSRADLWRNGRRIGDHVSIILKNHPLGGLDIHTDYDLRLSQYALEIYEGA